MGESEVTSIVVVEIDRDASSARSRETASEPSNAVSDLMITWYPG